MARACHRWSLSRVILLGLPSARRISLSGVPKMPCAPLSIGRQRPSRSPLGPIPVARWRADDHLMHVAVDREDAPCGVGRQHVGISDQIAAPAPEVGAVGRKLDHARIVGMHQRIVPQHHEDMAARIDGDVGDKTRVARPGAEGTLDAIEPVSKRNDQFM